MAEKISKKKLTDIINLQYTKSDTIFSGYDMYINGIKSFISGGPIDSYNSMIKLYKKEYDNSQKINKKAIYDKEQDIKEREKMI